MSKYTLGPWKVAPVDGPRLTCVHTDKTNIALLVHQEDAHLIASAPELLEACIHTRKTIDEILSYVGAKFNTIPHHSGRGAIRLDSVIDSLEQAIAKAEGR